jgi:hypothetical protein
MRCGVDTGIVFSVDHGEVLIGIHKPVSRKVAKCAKLAKKSVDFSFALLCALAWA